MIGRFFGFATDALSDLARLFQPATDVQVAAAERGFVAAAALNDVEAEHDGLPEPAEAMTPDVGFSWPTADDINRDTLSVLADGFWCAQHQETLGWCRHLHTSAASIPPGASDASPVQDPPHPAPGFPNPLPACEAGSEGSGVDSDIPQSATPERLIVMCPLGGKCLCECDRTQGGCVTIYGPVVDHEEALRRNAFESELTDFQLGYLTAVELLESLARSDRETATKLMDKNMAFQFFQEANSFEGTAKYMRRCLTTSQQANPAN